MEKLILALSIGMWIVCVGAVVTRFVSSEPVSNTVFIMWVVITGIWTLSCLLWSRSCERYERLLKEMMKK